MHLDPEGLADQISGPTPAGAIADALYSFARQIQAGANAGIQHFAGAPHASWADLARAIMAAAGVACQITDIFSSAYPTPAQRPLNSRLDCSGLARYRLTSPNWYAALPQIIKDLT